MDDAYFFDLNRKYGSLKARDTSRRVWHFLLEIYPSYLQAIRKELKSILEVGVYKGGSILALHDYCPNAKIVGVDRDLSYVPESRFKYEMEDFERIKLIEADQEDSSAMRKVGEEHGKFEVIIDDAGHRALEQIKCFEVLWPYVVAGGLYFIEDVFREEKPLQLKDYFLQTVQSFCTKPGVYRNLDIEFSHIAFYPGMIVIKKSVEKIR